MNQLRLRLENYLEILLADIPPRQRPLLFIGLGALVLLLIWLLLLAPVASARAELTRQIETREQELAWMQEAAREVRQYTEAGREVVDRRGTPLAVIDGSAREVGLGQALQRVEPAAGGEEVRVWLEGAPFDDLLRWLGALVSGHGIGVTEIVVEPDRSSTGLVDVRLTLVRD